MARATAVTQMVDAVALKAQKSVLSTSLKTEIEDFFRKREECMSAYYRIKIHFRSQSEIITSTQWFKVGFEQKRW